MYDAIRSPLDTNKSIPHNDESYTGIYITSVIGEIQHNSSTLSILIVFFFNNSYVVDIFYRFSAGSSRSFSLKLNKVD